jgi:hypothetical protein
MPSSGLFGAGRQLEDDALDDIVSFTEHLLELGIVGMADFMVQVCQAPFEDLQQYVLLLLSEIERFHGLSPFLQWKIWPIRTNASHNAIQQ